MSLENGGQKEVRVAGFIIIPSDPLKGFVLLVSATMCSVALKILFQREHLHQGTLKGFL